ncbi:MAG: MFS transporter [Opitutus sp.]
MLRAKPQTSSLSAIYWTALIGLFFDYYDLYLFIYLEKVLGAQFGLSAMSSNLLQLAGLAGVGLGAIVFGYLADRLGRERVLLAVFVLYVVALTGLSASWNFSSLLGFRVLASLALGAEWGISHAWMSERVPGNARYRFSAFLQFAILGGLAAALANRYLLPMVGWRWLFAASIVPVVVLSAVRWVAMRRSADPTSRSVRAATPTQKPGRVGLNAGELRSFAKCFALASLTIASGTLNVFFVKELPQSTLYTILFWGNVAPGMLLGVVVVRWLGVRGALLTYAASLIAVALMAWKGILPGGKLAFALVLPVLNGIPFGLMGAYFTEVFARFPAMMAGSAYNLGRILAGFSPFVIAWLGLNRGTNYFLFCAALGVGVVAIGWGITSQTYPTSQR